MKFPNYTLGLFTGFCLGCLYFMTPAIIEGFRKPVSKDTITSKFVVVDQYKGCDVVRWNDGDFSNYKYFLHCKP